MKKLILIAAIIIFCSTGNIFSQVFAGNSAAQFLKIEPGARAIGMGGAFSAIADDASAIFWNPAGIAKLKNNSATFSHTFWLVETNHDMAGLVLKIGDVHSLGISYTALTMPDMKVRNEYYQEGTGEYFSAADYSIGLTYAMSITDEFSIGFTGKYITQSIWHMSASTVGFDIGIHYLTPWDNLKLGMSVSNIGGKIKYGGEDNFIYYSYDKEKHGNSDKIFAEIKMDEWDLPLQFRVGLAYDINISENNRITASCDAIHPNDYTEFLNTGMEYAFKERFFLRVGYKALFKEESEEGLTAGVGLIYYLTDYLPLRVDYAYADFGRLEEIHRFSVEFEF